MYNVGRSHKDAIKIEAGMDSGRGDCIDEQAKGVAFMQW